MRRPAAALGTKVLINNISKATTILPMSIHSLMRCILFRMLKVNSSLNPEVYIIQYVKGVFIAESYYVCSIKSEFVNFFNILDRDVLKPDNSVDRKKYS